MPILTESLSGLITHICTPIHTCHSTHTCNPTHTCDSIHACDPHTPVTPPTPVIPPTPVTPPILPAIFWVTEATPDTTVRRGIRLSEPHPHATPRTTPTHYHAHHHTHHHAHDHYYHPITTPIKFIIISVTWLLPPSITRLNIFTTTQLYNQPHQPYKLILVSYPQIHHHHIL